jgi:cytochrome c oxidase subunit 1
MSTASTSHAHPSTGAHDAHHEELGFFRKYVFSTDHKVIGIQYGITSLLFLFFGLGLMLCMRRSRTTTNPSRSSADCCKRCSAAKWPRTAP